MSQNLEDISRDSKMTSCMDTSTIAQIATEMYRIRWEIENFSKVALNKKLNGPDFHLAPTCLVGISLQKNEHDMLVYVSNKSNTNIKIQRKIVFFTCKKEILHENKDAHIFMLEKGHHTNIINMDQNRKIFDTLLDDVLIIDLSITMIVESFTEISQSQNIADLAKNLPEDFNMKENSVDCGVYWQIGEEPIPARRIMSVATVENVFQILMFSHRHDDENLLVEILRFIELHSDVVFQTDGFKKFKKSHSLFAALFLFALKEN